MRALVQLEADSDVRLRPGMRLQLSWPAEPEPFLLTVYTDYDTEEFGVPVPRRLRIEVDGEFPSLDEAVDRAGASSAFATALLAVSANAWVDDSVQLRLAYDKTDGESRHSFLQNHLSPATGLTKPKRFLDGNAWKALSDAVGVHEEGRRLARAVFQYRAALRYWRNGYEVHCLSHLFMGMEALKVTALRQHLRTTGRTEQDLAGEWNVQDNNRMREFLEREARRRLLFRGDDPTHRKARDASDWFEHGAKPLGQVFELAMDCVDQTARYLREAILDLGGVPEPHRSVMLGNPYAEPLESWHPNQQVRGFLTGTPKNLAPPGERHPFLEWRVYVAGVKAREGGEYNVMLISTITNRFGEGVNLEDTQVEVWGPVTIGDIKKGETP